LNQIVADAERLRRRKQMGNHPKPTPISPVILAEFPGVCERCEIPIRPGHAIVRARFWDKAEDWVHAACASKPDDPVRHAQTEPVMTPPPDAEPRRPRLLADGSVSLWTGPGREQIISRRHPHYELFRERAESIQDP